eukprot:TRINITY_DN4209_c0_g1_i1.p2 TRINITY_DN4209_c0_g1~~TRINITY_DN4209_c0_g1_i1.p2  ORF type:complete len:116 (-),score=10.72 TRINITY_DN4209_c0_g1_i1:755-1102(-)
MMYGSWALWMYFVIQLAATRFGEDQKCVFEQSADSHQLVESKVSDSDEKEASALLEEGGPAKPHACLRRGSAGTEPSRSPKRMRKKPAPCKRRAGPPRPRRRRLTTLTRWSCSTR